MESLIPIDSEEEITIAQEPIVEKEVVDETEATTKHQAEEVEAQVLAEEELDPLSILDKKVSEIVLNFNSSSDQNSILRNEIMTLKAQNELQSNQIQNLEDKLLQKDQKIESILKKISPLLGGE